MNAAYIEERIAKTKELIAIYEDATVALGTAGVQSYELDTGQSKQRVTKFDLDKLNGIIDSLYNRLCMLEARLNGGSATIARPGF